MLGREAWEAGVLVDGLLSLDPGPRESGATSVTPLYVSLIFPVVVGSSLFF